MSGMELPKDPREAFLQGLREKTQLYDRPWPITTETEVFDAPVQPPQQPAAPKTSHPAVGHDSIDSGAGVPLGSSFNPFHEPDDEPLAATAATATATTPLPLQISATQPPAKSWAAYIITTMALSLILTFTMYSFVSWYTTIEVTRSNIDRVTVVPGSTMFSFLFQAETYGLLSKVRQGPGSGSGSGTPNGIITILTEVTGLNGDPDSAPATTVSDRLQIAPDSKEECADLNGDNIPDCYEVEEFERAEAARLGRHRGLGLDEPSTSDEDEYAGTEADAYDLTPAKRRMYGIGRSHYIKKQEEEFLSMMENEKRGPSGSNSIFDPSSAGKMFQTALDALIAKEKAAKQLAQFAQFIKSMPSLGTTDVCGVMNQFDPVKKLIKAKRGCWDVVELILTFEYAPDVYQKNRDQMARENKALANRLLQREGKKTDPRTGARPPSYDKEWDENLSNQCLCSEHLGFVEEFVFACDGNPQTCTLFIEPVINKVTGSGGPVRFTESVLDYHPELEPRSRAATNQIHTYYSIARDNQYLPHPTPLNVTYLSVPSRKEMRRVFGDVFSWVYSAEHHLDSKVQSMKRTNRGEFEGPMEWVLDKLRLWSHANLTRKETFREIVTERDSIVLKKNEVSKHWLETFDAISEAKRNSARGRGAGHGTGSEADKEAAFYSAFFQGAYAIVASASEQVADEILRRAIGTGEPGTTAASDDADDFDQAGSPPLPSQSGQPLTPEEKACQKFTKEFMSRRYSTNSIVNSSFVSEAIEQGVTRRCLSALFTWPKLQKNENRIVGDFKAVCLAHCSRYSQLVKMGQVRHAVDTMQPPLSQSSQTVFDSMWAYHKSRLRSKNGLVM